MRRLRCRWCALQRIWESGSALGGGRESGAAPAGRYPNDKALRELIGALSTLSPEFRTRWAAHNVRIPHGGVKRFRHPEAGDLEVTFQPLICPCPPPARGALPHHLHRRTRLRFRRQPAPARILGSHPLASPTRQSPAR
ncbi:hypothetical protein L3078_36720 [Streptomyces deccanensis]|nr:hypothetical protein [Streptomyces deccanensis]ULR56259.1 hypothetical protein L3078_36720 [Streptomyces deccanensis]